MPRLIACPDLAMLGHAVPRNTRPDRPDDSLRRHRRPDLLARRAARTPGHDSAHRCEPGLAARSEHIELRRSPMGRHDGGCSAVFDVRGARLALRPVMASLGRSLPVDHDHDPCGFRPESGHPQPGLSVDILPALLRRTGGDRMGHIPERRA